MKSLKLIVGAGLMLAAVAASAQMTPDPLTPSYLPGSGIKGTKHDWSSTSGQTLLLWNVTNAQGVTSQTTYNTGTPYMTTNAQGQTVQGTTKVQIGLCTKCHTPHQAKTTALLWNHTLQATQYKWDDPATTAGTTYPGFRGDTYKGSTTKCLSCHDGLMASTDGMWFGRQMVSGNKYVAPIGSLNSGHEVAEGANMSKTHPVAMPYPLNGSANTYNFVSNVQASIESAEWVADPMATNKIRLFKDDGAGNITAGTAAGKTGIECSSCHDVHNGARVKDVILLTGKINGADRSPGGYICTQCHLK